MYIVFIDSLSPYVDDDDDDAFAFAFAIAIALATNSTPSCLRAFVHDALQRQGGYGVQQQW